jgi:hypothetical protein
LHAVVEADVGPPMLTASGVAVICLLLLLAVAALLLSEALGSGGIIERGIAQLFPDRGASSPDGGEGRSDRRVG